jgi:hypothetical protein
MQGELKSEQTKLAKMTTTLRHKQKKTTFRAWFVKQKNPREYQYKRVQCIFFLSSLPLRPPANTAVFGSYLSSLYS